MNLSFSLALLLCRIDIRTRGNQCLGDRKCSNAGAKATVVWILLHAAFLGTWLLFQKGNSNGDV